MSSEKLVRKALILRARATLARGDEIAERLDENAQIAKIVKFQLADERLLRAISKLSIMIS